MEKKTKRQYDEKLERLKKTIGTDLALYCLCAVFDVPYLPNEKTDSFFDYMEKTKKESIIAKFEDGETDVFEAINSGMTQLERWKKYWGDGSEKHPYKEKDYKRLDELKRSMSGQLDSLGALTAQQEDVARQCAIWTLQCEKLSANGDKESVSTAKMLDEMKRKNLEDCNMRSRDILPARQQRPAGFAIAIKEKLGIDGEVTFDAFMEAFYKWCKGKKYPMTIDAVHHAQLAIHQAIAQNNDLPLPQELPDYADLSDFSYEFASFPNEAEDETFKYLGYISNKEKIKKSGGV